MLFREDVMKSSGVVWICLIAALALAAQASAKGTTVRVTVTGIGFAAPIELTGAQALSFQNGPWGGGFLDSAAGAALRPPATSRLCELEFYVRYQSVELAYVIYYEPSGTSAPGYVYLPGKGDPWYALNAGTILRPGRDGTWRRASREWEDAVIKPALERSGLRRRPAS
jgi:hypothetical protein